MSNDRTKSNGNGQKQPTLDFFIHILIYFIKLPNIYRRKVEIKSEKNTHTEKSLVWWIIQIGCNIHTLIYIYKWIEINIYFSWENKIKNRTICNDFTSDVLYEAMSPTEINTI